MEVRKEQKSLHSFWMPSFTKDIFSGHAILLTQTKVMRNWIIKFFSFMRQLQSQASPVPAECLLNQPVHCSFPPSLTAQPVPDTVITTRTKRWMTPYHSSRGSQFSGRGRSANHLQSVLWWQWGQRGRAHSQLPTCTHYPPLPHSHLLTTPTHTHSLPTPSPPHSLSTSPPFQPITTPLILTSPTPTHYLPYSHSYPPPPTPTNYLPPPPLTHYPPPLPSTHYTHPLTAYSTSFTHIDKWPIFFNFNSVDRLPFLVSLGWPSHNPCQSPRLPWCSKALCAHRTPINPYWSVDLFCFLSCLFKSPQVTIKLVCLVSFIKLFFPKI